MEQNTDDILNNPEKCDKNKNKNKSQEDVEETVSKCNSTCVFHGQRTTFVIEFICIFQCYKRQGTIWSIHFWQAMSVCWSAI